MTYVLKQNIFLSTIPLIHILYLLNVYQKKRNIHYISFLDISSHPLWRYDYNGFFKTKSLVDGIVNDIQDNLLFYKKMGRYSDLSYLYGFITMNMF